MNIVFWLLPLLVAAWTAQELEIFNLRDAVVQDMGEEATFYSWLGVSKKADRRTINAAYRKLSRALHPDKVPGLEAQERYARLNRINKLLQGPGRDTYDFYLRKGFPALRDGDYLFSRYRPGILTVVIFVLAAFVFVNYLVLKATASRRRAQIQSLLDAARAKAQGPLQVITAKQRVRLENGKEFIVDTDNSVRLVDGLYELPINIEELEEPSVFDTLPFRIFKRSPASATQAANVSAEASVDGKVEATEAKRPSARHRPAAAKGRSKVFG